MDDNLIAVYINDDINPFKGWSVAKICCYKIHAHDGIVMMATPYVDSRMIEHFDALGSAEELNASDIADVSDGLITAYEMAEVNTDDIATNSEAIAESFEISAINSDDIETCMSAIEELYEIIGGM